jgi:hypothetical protein
MLAGRYLDVVILGVIAVTLAELLADGRPVTALVSAGWSCWPAAGRR